MRKQQQRYLDKFKILEMQVKALIRTSFNQKIKTIMLDPQTNKSFKV